MKTDNIVLGVLVVLGIAAAAGVVSNQLVSDGEVTVEAEPENTEEPAITFENGETTRGADFSGDSVEPGSQLFDSFTIQNNHDEPVDVTLANCDDTDFLDREYNGGTDGSFTVEGSGSLDIDVSIQVPENAEGQYNICTEVESIV